jgi:hypothetical protein
MAEKGTDKRLKLTITEVKDRQPVGEKGAVKLAFKAKEGEEGKELPYFTFSTRLFETIEKGGEIDCDVNISKREWTTDDGEPMTFTDRKVTQIYIDGQPVGGRRGGYGDSPETRASIEAQKRADIIAQLWIAGKIKDDSPEVKKMRAWLMEEPTKAPAPEKKAESKKEPEEIFPEEESRDDTPTTELLSRVAEAKGFKSDKTARSYLVKSLHIEESRIDSEPEAVWEEIKEYFA